MRLDEVEKHTARYLNKALQDLNVAVTLETYSKQQRILNDYILYPTNARTGKEYTGAQKQNLQAHRLENIKNLKIPKTRKGILNLLLGREKVKQFEKAQAELIGVKTNLNEYSHQTFERLFSQGADNIFTIIPDSLQWQDPTFLVGYEMILAKKEIYENPLKYHKKNRITKAQFTHYIKRALNGNLTDEEFKQYNLMRIRNAHYTAKEWHELKTGETSRYILRKFKPSKK